MVSFSVYSHVVFRLFVSVFPFWIFGFPVIGSSHYMRTKQKQTTPKSEPSRCQLTSRTASSCARVDVPITGFSDKRFSYKRPLAFCRTEYEKFRGSNKAKGKGSKLDTPVPCSVYCLRRVLPRGPANLGGSRASGRQLATMLLVDVI